jgi:PAB1-binding protein PBP1
MPDADDDGGLLGLEGGGGGGGEWDQFAVNREKFGVESTFDEHIYTTKIDRKNCAISEAEAERLAREIERGNNFATSNVHLLEERGIIVDDSGVREGSRPA